MTLMSDKETGVTTPAAEETVTEPVMIPKERMDAVIEQKKMADDKAVFAQQQADFYKQQEQLRAANGPQVDICKELGLVDDDIATVAQQKVIDSHNMSKVEGRIKQLESQLGEAAFVLQHPDAQEVFNGDLKQLIESDPEIGTLLGNLPKDQQVKMAYKIGKMQSNLQAKSDHAKTKATVDTAIDNATRPLSASAVGGSTSGLSTGTKYRDMTGAEIAAMSRRAAQG